MTASYSRRTEEKGNGVRVLTTTTLNLMRLRTWLTGQPRAQQAQPVALTWSATTAASAFLGVALANMSRHQRTGPKRKLRRTVSLIIPPP